ncbi:metaxin-2-like isoform 2 protein [Lasius niger]|uniref:Metaxin-2-like isoform 2 protein n=1 Tax=Lasius niger TaxID=67767 RepID=A0A0J7L5Q4_LASNI|nr:metaxin-2-like isoform 2 protein [Lasius niger]
MHACQMHAFQDTEKKNDMSLQARVLHAFLSAAKFSKDESQLNAKQAGDVICAEQSLDLQAQEPWPQPITLYQPYEVEQILLPDNANCLAVQAFLKMCQLDFQIEPRKNAEFMSPSGRVPFIKCGTKLISEYDGIVTHIGSKGISLSDHLDSAAKVDMRAYLSLVNNVFVNAELYICWVDTAILNAVTKPRHGSVYPWPLNHYLNWQKRREVIKKLNVLGWYNKSLDEVFDDVRKCCIALSERLADEEFFFGKDPTEIDALMYGHIHALTSSPSFSSNQGIIATIRQFPKLIEHMFRIKHRYFSSEVQNKIAEEFEIIESPSRDTLKPNELDALVFGHIFTIITTPLSNNKLAMIVQNHPKLVNLCKRIETSLFSPQAIDSQTNETLEFKN